MRAKKLLRAIGGTAVVVLLALLAAYLYLDEEKTTLDDEIRAALPGQFVELSDGVVHYELAGPENGPTVVLVHGFSVPYYVWDPTFDALAVYWKQASTETLPGAEVGRE